MKRMGHHLHLIPRPRTIHSPQHRNLQDQSGGSGSQSRMLAHRSPLPAHPHISLPHNNSLHHNNNCLHQQHTQRAQRAQELRMGLPISYHPQNNRVLVRRHLYKILDSQALMPIARKRKWGVKDLIVKPCSAIKRAVVALEIQKFGC